MTDAQHDRITHLLHSANSSVPGLAWARTKALGELVLDGLTGDRDDEGVRVLHNQLNLAAVITLSSGGDLAVAAAHHDRLAADLDAVRSGEDPRSHLGSAVLAHRLAAEICRGDYTRLRLFATRRKDGHDYTAALQLRPV